MRVSSLLIQASFIWLVDEVLLYVHRNRRFNRDGSPGRSPRLSQYSWARLFDSVAACVLYTTMLMNFVVDCPLSTVNSRTVNSSCSAPVARPLPSPPSASPVPLPIILITSGVFGACFSQGYSTHNSHHIRRLWRVFQSRLNSDQLILPISLIISVFGAYLKATFITKSHFF